MVLGRALDLLQHASHGAITVCTGMPEDSHAGELRHNIFKQLQSLGNQLRAKKACARHIPARPCQAGNQIVLDRIGHAYCNDRNLAGRLLGWTGGRRTLCHNDIDLPFNQFSSGLAKSIRGILIPGCASVRSGQATIAPPRTVLKSRRLIRSPHRRAPGMIREW